MSLWLNPRIPMCRAPGSLDSSASIRILATSRICASGLWSLGIINYCWTVCEVFKSTTKHRKIASHIRKMSPRLWGPKLATEPLSLWKLSRTCDFDETCMRSHKENGRKATGMLVISCHANGTCNPPCLLSILLLIAVHLSCFLTSYISNFAFDSSIGHGRYLLISTA